MVQVILQGGPASFPAQLRRQSAQPGETVVKVEHCGGYEHFECDEETEDEPLLFRWTRRTAIAE